MSNHCDKCGRYDCVCVLQCDACFAGFDVGDECPCGGRVRQWTPCVVESPYGGSPREVARNLRYLRACLHWCVHNGYTPYASHGLLTQPGVLRDGVRPERLLGVGAGLALGDLLPVRIVFEDLGRTSGMVTGIRRGEAIGQFIRYEKLGPGWIERVPQFDGGWVLSLSPQPEDAPNAGAWRTR